MVNIQKQAEAEKLYCTNNKEIWSQTNAEPNP